MKVWLRCRSHLPHCSVFPLTREEKDQTHKAALDKQAGELQRLESSKATLQKLNQGLKHQLAGKKRG